MSNNYSYILHESELKCTLFPVFIHLLITNILGCICLQESTYI